MMVFGEEIAWQGFLVKVLSMTDKKRQTILPDDFRHLAKDFKVRHTVKECGAIHGVVYHIVLYATHYYDLIVVGEGGYQSACRRYDSGVGSGCADGVAAKRQTKRLYFQPHTVNACSRSFFSKSMGAVAVGHRA